MEQPVGSDGIIKLENISLTLQKKLILKDINITFLKNKINTLIGPSGSGKSTILDIITGFKTPDSGKVLIDDIDINKLSYKKSLDFRRKRLGIMFQDLGLFDDLTVEENIMLPLALNKKIKENEKEKRVNNIITDLYLAGSEKKFPSQLSGGMKKRVAIGRALILEPDILILDEPTSGLDPVISASLENLLLSIKDNMKKTLIIISHDIETTKRLSDYIGVIFNGELIDFNVKDKILSSDNPIIKQYFTREPVGPITNKLNN